MTGVAEPHRGEVELVLGEDRFVLRPTIAAITAIEARYGAIGKLQRQLVERELPAAAMAGIAAIAVGEGGPKEREILKRVPVAGIDALRDPLLRLCLTMTFGTEKAAELFAQEPPEPGNGGAGTA